MSCPVCQKEIVPGGFCEHTREEISKPGFNLPPASEVAPGGLLLDVLGAIERTAGDDFCEELDMSNALTRKLTGRIAVAHQKLSAIYRLSHAFNPRHSCYWVHESWRQGFGSESAVTAIQTVATVVSGITAMGQATFTVSHPAPSEPQVAEAPAIVIEEQDAEKWMISQGMKFDGKVWRFMSGGLVTYGLGGLLTFYADHVTKALREQLEQANKKSALQQKEIAEWIEAAKWAAKQPEVPGTDWKARCEVLEEILDGVEMEERLERIELSAAPRPQEPLVNLEILANQVAQEIWEDAPITHGGTLRCWPGTDHIAEKIKKHFAQFFSPAQSPEPLVTLSQGNQSGAHSLATPTIYRRCDSKGHEGDLREPSQSQGAAPEETSCPKCGEPMMSVLNDKGGHEYFECLTAYCSSGAAKEGGKL